MIVVIYIVLWFFILYWVVVVRYIIWFFVIVYFIQVLVRKFYIFDYVMYQNFIFGLWVELNFFVVMVIRMDYVEFKGSNIINNKIVCKIVLVSYFVNMNFINISF